MKRALVLLAVLGCGPAASPPKSLAPRPDRSMTACTGDPVAKEAGARELAADLEGLPIVRIDVAGNRAIMPSTILAATGLRLGSALSHGAVARAIRSIYESGEIDDVDVWAQHEGAGVVLTIAVRERPRIAEIFAPGIPDATKIEMAKWLGIERGLPFDVAHVYEQRRAISEGMAHRGASFDIRSHLLTNNEVDVCILVKQ